MDTTTVQQWVANEDLQYLPPAGATDFLLLDTKDALVAFISTTAHLHLPDRDERLEEYLDDLLQYMIDRSEIPDYIEEYLLEELQTLQQRGDHTQALQFVQALRQLAVHLCCELENAKAWDRQGVLPYCFDTLAGLDVVLRRVNLQFGPAPMCKDG